MSEQLRAIRQPQAAGMIRPAESTQATLSIAARGISLGRVHAPQDTLRISCKGFLEQAVLSWNRW